MLFACMYATEDVTKPYRELFVWAVFFNKKSLAQLFWEHCPNQLGSALVANLLFKSMSRAANSPFQKDLAHKLSENAGSVALLSNMTLYFLLCCT